MVVVVEVRGDGSTQQTLYRKFMTRPGIAHEQTATDMTDKDEDGQQTRTNMLNRRALNSPRSIT